MFATQWYGRFVRKYNLPALFVVGFFVGSACEYVMIKWSVGETNFYSTVIEKEVKKTALRIVEKEQKGLF